MSKYTSEDSDVKEMDDGDRVQYEFDLLQHDVDRMVEASYATMAIRNRAMIKEQMKQPKRVYIGIIMFLVHIFTILFIVLFALWLYQRIKGSDNSINLRRVMVSVLCMLLLLIVITLTVNSMQSNMTELVEMSKEPKKED